MRLIISILHLMNGNISAIFLLLLGCTFTLYRAFRILSPSPYFLFPSVRFSFRFQKLYFSLRGNFSKNAKKVFHAICSFGLHQTKTFNPIRTFGLHQTKCFNPIRTFGLHQTKCFDPIRTFGLHQTKCFNPFRSFRLYKTKYFDSIRTFELGKTIFFDNKVSLNINLKFNNNI